MFEGFAKAQLDRFEREWDYDVSYMREILDAGGIEALRPMRALETISGYRRDCPQDVYFTAKMLAVRAGDCGPCLRLGVRMAEREGMAPAHIRAVLTGDRDAMTEDVRVAYDFTRSVLARDGWDTPARDEIVRRFGKRALIALSYGIAVGGFYPAFKYAFGVGHACERIAVGDDNVVPIST